MRCPRCGNENSDSHRFCGMCGGSLLPAQSPIAAATERAAASGSSTPVSVMPSPATPPSAARSTPAPPNPLPARTATGVSDVDNAPTVISGPSFLGLNDPGPRKAARLNNDPHGSPSSGNLDYLLEDEEEPRRGTGAKFVLMLLALALALGFGYLRWKNHGLPFLSANANKPATVPSSDSTDANTTLPPASNPTSTSSSSPSSAPASGVAGAPGTPAAVQPASDSTANSSIPAAGSPPTNPPAGSVPTSAAPATTAPTSSGTAPDPADNSSATSAPTHKDKSNDADKDADAADPNSPPAASTKSNEPAPKPHAAILRVAPTDNVAEAQKYIYGRGVAQDCERGMRLLKPAANQANPKAMIEMGALYSAGLCTPHDLPTAYRWFARALRKEPDNQAVQTDLQKLWGEMTQPERQLAIKLSQ